MWIMEPLSEQKEESALSFTGKTIKKCFFGRNPRERRSTFVYSKQKQAGRHINVDKLLSRNGLLNKNGVKELADGNKF